MGAGQRSGADRYVIYRAICPVVSAWLRSTSAMSHMNMRSRGSSRYHNTCESLRPLSLRKDTFALRLLLTVLSWRSPLSPSDPFCFKS